jgi:hypothetical protein
MLCVLLHCYDKYIFTFVCTSQIYIYVLIRFLICAVKKIPAEQKIKSSVRRTGKKTSSSQTLETKKKNGSRENHTFTPKSSYECESPQIS